MSQYVVGGLIGAGVTVVVWVLTTVRDALSERRRRQDYNRTILKGALADYLAALDSLTIEVMDQPPTIVPTRVDRTLDRLANRLGLGFPIWFLVRLLRRLAYGDRAGDLTDRMAMASAHLRLVAPQEVLELMQELDSILGRQPYDEAWKEDWREARERLRSGFRSALPT